MDSLNPPVPPFFVFSLFILTFLLASLAESACVPRTRPWLQLRFVQFLVMIDYSFMTAMFPTVHNTFPPLIHYVNPTDSPFTDFHADSSFH